MINQPATDRVRLLSSFFLDNQLLETAEMEFLEVCLFPTRNILYICPFCSNLWGRWLVDKHAWHPQPAYCPKHCPKRLESQGIDLRLSGPRWLWSFPGGSFMTHLTLTPDRLPPKLLEYEFNLWSNFREHTSN